MAPWIYSEFRRDPEETVLLLCNFYSVFHENTLHICSKNTIFQQILNVRRLGARDRNYKAFRLDAVKKQFPYCHPRWVEEKEYYDEEVTRILK